MQAREADTDAQSNQPEGEGERDIQSFDLPPDVVNHSTRQLIKPRHNYEID
jgi:hypothetical protein